MLKSICSGKSASHDFKTFEEHNERMKAFRRAHQASNDIGARDYHGSISPKELRKILPPLKNMGYLLNLIQERSTVILPENWQN